MELMQTMHVTKVLATYKVLHKKGAIITFIINER